MTHLQNTSRESEKGFTLVELAVVMIIIGLLIGGILKGQELITNAQVASTVTAVKGIDAAVSTFRDSYNAFPGDMSAATGRLPNCVAGNNCFNGGGNSRVDNAVDGTGAAAAAGNVAGESGSFFVHMATADMITGVTPTGGAAPGGQFPESPLGGGFTVGHTGAGTVDAEIGGLAASPPVPLLSSHYITLSADLGTGINAGNGPISSAQAARIDRKMDDGDAETGGVRASTGGTCLDSVTTGTGTSAVTVNSYDEAGGGGGCNMVFRIQG